MLTLELVHAPFGFLLTKRTQQVAQMPGKLYMETEGPNLDMSGIGTMKYRARQEH